MSFLPYWFPLNEKVNQTRVSCTAEKLCIHCCGAFSNDFSVFLPQLIFSYPGWGGGLYRRLPNRGTSIDLGFTVKSGAKPKGPLCGLSALGLVSGTYNTEEG